MCRQVSKKAIACHIHGKLQNSIPFLKTGNMRGHLALLFTLISLQCWGQKKWELHSPDRRIRIDIELAVHLTYSVIVDNRVLLDPSPVDMLLDDGRAMSVNNKLKRSGYQEIRETITPAVPEKRSSIPDHYNMRQIELRNGFKVQFRAYNDGVAYRLITELPDTINILHETALYQLHQPAKAYYSEVVPRDQVDSFHTSFEEPYTISPVDSIGNNSLIFSPLLIRSSEGLAVVLTESDLEDYPGMFMSGHSNKSLSGRFAAYPLSERITEGEFPAAVVTKRAPYIARTSGSRHFPWRVMIIAREDRELPANDLVYRLGAPSRLKNTSWIKPGKGTDEWIIGINLFNVPFKSGINNATYRYYIDFAKRFGFQRIMMDAGWSDYKDLFRINPNINMDSIAAYARQEGIGLSLWTLAHTLDRQLDSALKQFQKWGVDFIMTDFMDRDDQVMVNFYHRVAAACAQHQIMVMFHGAFKPAGFSRTWPNAVTREGVLGSEYNIWSHKANPEHDLLLPFIRMTAGPMDYEPGILDNATTTTFRPISEKVMSQGTRCHQAAMFAVYESPIQLFSGNPSQGWLEPEFMELVGSVPTVWDSTIVIEGKLGDYIVTARRSGKEWFIGAMTDWTPRELSVQLDFLNNGEYNVIHAKDGVNADRYPSDYIIERERVSASDQLTIRMAPGGGALIRLIPVQ